MAKTLSCLFYRTLCFVVLTSGLHHALAGPSHGGVVYLSDAGDRVLQRMGASGGSVETLVAGLKSPRGIAIDSANRYLYWTEGGPGVITRGRLDGSEPVRLIETGISDPIALAIDVPNGKMYWTDTGTGKVQRSDLDGNAVEDLVVLEYGNPRGLALDLVNGKIYWGERSPSRIRRANLDGTNPETIPIAYDDNTGPQSMALDVAAGKIYWANGNRSLIQRANLDGSSVENLVYTGGPPYGIALDPAAGKVYWSGGAGPGVLRRANLDGSDVEILIEGQLNRFHGIAIDNTPIPEPGSLSLFAIAAISFAALRRRREWLPPAAARWGSSNGPTP
jgi:low density lipoprotein receptor-related protein 5/6